MFVCSVLIAIWILPCLTAGDWKGGGWMENMTSVIRAWAGLHLRGSYCFYSNDFFVPNDCIFHYLNIPQNSPNLENRSQLPHCECPPLGGTIIQESAFRLITPYTLSHIQKTYIHTFTELCWVSWYRPRPFLHPFSFFANWWNVANLLFRTPAKQFHWFTPNFPHTICGPSWQKVIKRILILQTVLKLLNNHLLYILLKTQSVAYLHIDVS